MFATHTLQDACTRLDSAIQKRLAKTQNLDEFEIIRYPVGLFFIRGDRAGDAKEITEQVVASYDYWNDDSGAYFDMVFPGWGKDGKIIDFNKDAYMGFRDEVMEISKWKPTGESEIILLNYDYRIQVWHGPAAGFGEGEFSFEEVILLPIEEMLRDNKIGSLDGFMQEMVNSAKINHRRTDESVLLAIRDKVAMPKARKAVWEELKKFVKHFAGIFDALLPYRVRNLQK